MRKYLLKNKKGFSLAELLVASAVAGILILFVTKIATEVMRGKAKTDEASAFLQVENAIIQVIARRISALASDATGAARCNAGGLAGFVNNFGVQTLPGIGTITPLTAINYAANPRQDVTDAINRCKTIVVPNTVLEPTGETQPGAYYFCVNFSRGGAPVSSNTSFFDAESAFAEIRINLVNTSDALAVHSGPFLSCTDFRTNPSGGVVVYYKAYWRKTGDKSEFTQAGKVLLPK